MLLERPGSREVKGPSPRGRRHKAGCRNPNVSLPLFFFIAKAATTSTPRRRPIHPPTRSRKKRTEHGRELRRRPSSVRGDVVGLETLELPGRRSLQHRPPGRTQARAGCAEVTTGEVVNGGWRGHGRSRGPSELGALENFVPLV